MHRSTRAKIFPPYPRNEAQTSTVLLPPNSPPLRPAALTQSLKINALGWSFDSSSSFSIHLEFLEQGPDGKRCLVAITAMCLKVDVTPTLCLAIGVHLVSVVKVAWTQPPVGKFGSRARKSEGENLRFVDHVCATNSGGLALSVPPYTRAERLLKPYLRAFVRL